MGWSEAISRDAVFDATREFDELGRDEFLSKYSYSPARRYFLALEGKRYDSKAIVGVARKYAQPGLGPLRPSEFSGGEQTVVRLLESLGFAVAVTDGGEIAEQELGWRLRTWETIRGRRSDGAHARSLA